MSTATTRARKPLGRPRVKTPAAETASLLEQRRDADRTRQVARIERVAQAGGRLISPILLDGPQAGALERIMKRDGCGISDAVRAALLAYASHHKRQRRAP